MSERVKRMLTTIGQWLHIIERPIDVPEPPVVDTTKAERTIRLVSEVETMRRDITPRALRIEDVFIETMRRSRPEV